MSAFSEMFFSLDRPTPFVRLRRTIAHAMGDRRREKEYSGDLVDADRVESSVHATLADIREIIGEPPPYVPFREAAE